MLTRRFSDKHGRIHRFSQLVALRQGPGGLDEYMEKFLELQTQVPDMNALDALDIYLGGLDHMVRIHLLGSQHVTTLERALEESRIFANAHRGHGVPATGRVDIYDDPMDLTFQAPLPRHAESARPPMRSPFTLVRCFNCGQTGHMRSACRAHWRSPSAMPFGGGFGQRTSRSPPSNADAFRAGGASPQCFVCGSSAHLARECPSRSASSGRPPPGRVQAMQQSPVDRYQVRLQTSNDHPPDGCIFAMQDEASSLSTKPVVSPGVFPRSSDPTHVSLG